MEVMSEIGALVGGNEKTGVLPFGYFDIKALIASEYLLWSKISEVHGFSGSSIMPAERVRSMDKTTRIVPNMVLVLIKTSGR